MADGPLLRSGTQFVGKLPCGGKWTLTPYTAPDGDTVVMLSNPAHPPMMLAGDVLSTIEPYHG